jgi:hypothetical protein
LGRSYESEREGGRKSSEAQFTENRRLKARTDVRKTEHRQLIAAESFLLSVFLTSVRAMRFLSSVNCKLLLLT